VSIAQLKTEAREAATSRGHELSIFIRLSARRYFAICTKCSGRVYINSAPMPNEIEISGEPVAAGCSGKKE